MRLADLSPDTVRTWHFELAEQKKGELGRRRAEAVAASRTVSAATRRTGASVARHAFLLLRAAMSTAAADELIRANPCRSIRGAGVAQGAERPTLSAAEVLHLAEVIFPRYRALGLLAAFSGLRFGELAALRRANLDLRTGRAAVRVIERVYRIDGALDFDTPKSRAGTRTVSIPDALAVELQRHLETYTSPEPDAFVFTSSNGHVLTAASLRILRRGVEQARPSPRGSGC
jgi:integrase